MVFMQRTVTCGALRASDEGKKVVLNGWVHRDRNHGALHFINLRDRYGITQVVVDDDADKSLQDTAAELKSEYVIAVEGIVRKRPDSMINKDMPTGEVEVKAQKIEILNRCVPLPFQIDEETDAKEDTRLKYRFLDLRSGGMQERIRLRHEFVRAIREFLSARDFYEIETPTLIRSTPEGARDFLVPSRLYAGKFYALPQSPQLMKQLLMVSGFDKYFQIARCYRDEDARGDRQLEFTQLDLEMSFVKRDDVLGLMEEMFGEVFRKVVSYELPVHFRRIAYKDSMNTYGCDKPDLRFGVEIRDFTPMAAKGSFEVYKQAKNVKAIVAPAKEGFEYTRKYLDELTEAAKVYGAKGMGWAKVGDGNTLTGGISKYFAGVEKDVIEYMGAHAGDVILVIADDKWKKCCVQIGALRSKIGKDLGLIDESKFEFCWIIDFPLFAYNEEESHWEAEHHMFSAPQDRFMDTLESDPGSVLGDLYDLVLNGYEVASGSIRIHDVELQKRIFRICNYDDAAAEEAFGFLLNAFKYGAPPHGGIAPGIDRLCMIICKQTSIKEVIAFPKNTAALDPMCEAPEEVTAQQIKDLHLIIDYPKEKE